MLSILGLIAMTSVLVIIFYVSVVDTVNQANLKIIEAAVAMQNSDCEVWGFEGDTLYCEVRAATIEGPVT